MMRQSQRRQQQEHQNSPTVNESPSQGVSNAMMQERLSEYTVEAGDTLWSLAGQFGLSVRDLQSRNQLWGTTINVGQVLSLTDQSSASSSSSSSTYIIMRGDSLWAIADKHQVSLVELCRVNGIDQNSIIHPNQSLVIPSGGGPSNAPQTTQPTNDSPERNHSPTSPSKPQPDSKPIPSKEKEFNVSIGVELAQASRRENGGSRYSKSDCYEYVANAVDRVMGSFLTGMHAYMAASQLAARKDMFKEIPPTGLSALPAGAIVVWGKGTSKSGHISIALGDGQESSDHIASQMLSHYGGAAARVFLPLNRMQ